MNSKLYFTAGPAKIPAQVKKQVYDEFMDYKGCGISVMELSHRSKEFDEIITEAEANLRKLLNVPDNYTILFMHGGANTQFAVVPKNLCDNKDDKVEYLINGNWCKKAASEAQKYVNVIKRVPNTSKYLNSFKREDLESAPDAKYRYYCDNETIEGIEFNYIPEAGQNCELISDMTSNFLSRPIDISKFGCIFASAQKNCGISGLAVVILRKDLLGKHRDITPTVETYQVMHDNRSLYNTPPTFAIYVAGLCFKWMIDQGGLEAMDRFSKEKSSLLYDFIDNSDGFYRNEIEKTSRSRMNVIWLLKDNSLDKTFADEARAANIFEIKGHRSVGGFRASLYHGVTIDDVKALVDFMKQFQKKHSSI